MMVELGELRDEIITDGREVYSLYWDSGAPGAGADYERVYKYQGTYYVLLSWGETYGPYETLLQGLRANDLLFVNETVEEIDCAEISAEKLVPDLLFMGIGEQVVAINGEKWRFAKRRI